MPSGFPTWSQTAASNASADSTINWAEGQAPSSVNDSARAMMAALAKYRDDNGSNLTTGGTSTAYTLTTNQGFVNTTLLNGQELSFQVHTTNGPNATITIDGVATAIIVGRDGLGNQVIPAGTLVGGNVYSGTYYSSVNEFRMKGFFASPYTVPIGGIIDFAGTTIPSSNFVFPTGQQLLRSTYSILFGIIGTTYGAGDGSTTFNVPDLAGRVVAMKDAGGVRLTGTYFPNAGSLGTVGGSDNRGLVTANLPPYTPAGSIANGSITITPAAGSFIPSSSGSVISNSSPGGSFGTTGGAPTASQGSSTFTGTAQGGTSTAFGIVQPTIILNKIIRII